MYIYIYLCNFCLKQPTDWFLNLPRMRLRDISPGGILYNGTIFGKIPLPTLAPTMNPFDCHKTQLTHLLRNSQRQYCVVAFVCKNPGFSPDQNQNPKSSKSLTRVFLHGPMAGLAHPAIATKDFCNLARCVALAPPAEGYQMGCGPHFVNGLYPQLRMEYPHVYIYIMGLYMDYKPPTKWAAHPTTVPGIETVNGQPHTKKA